MNQTYDNDSRHSKQCEITVFFWIHKSLSVFWSRGFSILGEFQADFFLPSFIRPNMTRFLLTIID
uniref:Uncharacterized protein n=1 Tax=Rhizophora mucronata TaxID=61149 RepID=A0A2P2QK22_RHIMU